MKRLLLCIGLILGVGVAVRSAGTVDLTVTHLEITQGTQTYTNQVRLVARRSTTVRATVGVSGSLTPVPGVSGRLHVWVDDRRITPEDGVLPLNESRTSPTWFTAPTATDRNNESDTLNFELRAPTDISRSSNVDFRVDIRLVEGEETDPLNNSKTADNLVCIDRAPPLLYFTKIDYTPAGRGFPDENLIRSCVGDAFVRGILPVNDAEPGLYQPAFFPAFTFSEDQFPQDLYLGTSGSSEGDNLLSLLACRRQLIVKAGLGADDRVFLFGWVGGDVVFGNGLADVDGRVAFGSTPAEGYQRTFAHELMHNFNLNHTSDVLNQVGWDVGARLEGNPSGNNTSGRVKGVHSDPLLILSDIRKAGRYTNRAWIGTSTYNSLLDHRTLDPIPLDEPTSRVLVVQGIMAQDGASLLQLKPVFRYPWLSRPTHVNATAMDEYPFVLEVIGENGEPTSVTFNAEVADGGQNEEKRLGFFEVMVPLEQEVRSVRIINKRTNRVLGGFASRSPAAPEISIEAPGVGTALDQQASVSLRIQDADTPLSQLLVQVAYSPDKGSSFVPIAVDLRIAEDTGEVKFTFDPKQIPPSRETGLIRVFASDGLNTEFEDVNGLSTPLE